MMETNCYNLSTHQAPPSGNSMKPCPEKTSTENDVSDSGFVNHAEIAWQQCRKEWLGDKSQKFQRVTREPFMRCMILKCWSMSYDDLLLTKERFPQPIPLAEMVDFLVDIWQDDGLYD